MAHDHHDHHHHHGPKTYDRAFLIGIALSTRAQSPFGLDGGSGLTRLRLLPMRGWQILLWKDAAYLGVQLLLTAGLNPASGVAFGLAAIAFGRYPAIRIRLPQQRWRFATGRVWHGVLQGVAGAMLGLNAASAPVPALAAAAVAYLISLYWAARAWDQT
jgi:Zn-dependent protease